MFDWEDQELANIIWGEADDHIVPYPEQSEKKSQSAFEHRGNNEANEEPANSKLSEQRRAATKTMLHGGKPESNADLSFLASNPEHNCIGKEVDVEKSSEISKDQNEDRELGDIISNSWANIGSFDDLDRMFSDDVLVDHAGLDSTDELWTSSRDAVKSSSLALDSTSWGLEPLGNSSGQFDFNTEYLHSGNQPFASRFEKPADSTCYTQERLNSSIDGGEIDATTDPNLILEKTALDVSGKTISEPQDVAGKVPSASKSSYKHKWSRSQSKHELKSDKMNDDREPRDIFGTWLPPEINVQQFDCQSAPDKSKSYLSSVHNQGNMPHQSTCLPYQNFPNPYMATYSYGNLSDPCTAMSILPGTGGEHQPVLSNKEACLSERVSMDNSTNTRIKNQNMTPQEKIEKLRRRQQMRALLAIKKQQQQLTHPVPITDYSMTRESSKEDQVPPLGKADFEVEENTATVLDPNSPLKQHGSSAVSEVVDHSAEDTVLDQLQGVVTKLDMKVRLCMRESLFRLAQSAMQRNYASNSSSGNRDDGCGPDVLKENMSHQESFIKMPNAETETNGIDRVVAHLLFHQPLKSTSKQPGSQVSSIPIKIPPGLEIGGSSSKPMSFITKISENEHKEESFQEPDTLANMNPKMKQKMVESVD